MYQQGYTGILPNNYNYYNLGDFGSIRYDNRLKVLGAGVVNAKPDKAEVLIGVITQNQQVNIAQKENTAVTQQVIDGMKNMGILPKDIQTQNYNIRAVYDYVEGKQIFRGYEVSNNVKVSIRDIDAVGQIIDAAVKNGANTVSGINFIVSDSSKYYNEALKLAIEDAENKAKAIANKLKVSLNIVPIQIVEQGRGGIAPLTAMTFKATNGGTPIEAGENRITATIEAIFIYGE